MVQILLLSILFFVLPVPVVSLGFVRILSYEQFLATITARETAGENLSPPVKWRLDSESLQEVSKWQRAVRSERRMFSSCMDGEHRDQCRAPRTKSYPFFPLTDAQRNQILQRPRLEVVRENIRKATRGAFSEVQELIDRIIANINDLTVLPDDELAVVASNFHNATTGWILSSKEFEIDDEGWPADLLFPLNESRAVMAAWLHVLSDHDFRDRGEQEITGWYKARGDVKYETRTYGTCQSNVKTMVQQFQDKVVELENNILLTDEAWLSKYEWEVAKLKANYYAMARGLPGDLPDKRISSIEELVAAAEEVVDKEICEGIENTKQSDPDFERFLETQQDGIVADFGSIRDSLVYRLAWRRWQRLSGANRAADSDIMSDRERSRHIRQES